MKNTNRRMVFNTLFGVNAKLDGLLMMLAKKPVLDMEWFNNFIFKNPKADENKSLAENVELLYGEKAKLFIEEWLNEDLTDSLNLIKEEEQLEEEEYDSN